MLHVLSSVKNDVARCVHTEKKMARDMTSVLEKVELLRSVGAEELADQALLKVMQLEIDRLQQEQQRLQSELKRFESQYRMSSETCQRKFDSG